MSSITLKSIKKIYPGNVVAIQDFNLEIEDGEFIIFVGPSGCGKSTTLRMIAGLEQISEGELYIGDKLVNDVPPKDRDIAMVFQNYALYPHMTVFKNMAFGLTLRKMPKEEIKQKIEEAAKVLEIEHLLDRHPKALSGGQRQRVALGRAMVRNPAIFLLDEPLSNLDAKLRNQMRAEISKLHKKLGITFVYVTHDQTEAMTMGDRIVVMKDGFIQQIDTPQNLYSSPCNLFVADFIGSPQMNFIEGTVVKNESGFALEFAGHRIDLPENKQKKLDAYTGKEVVLGIRPEDISITNNDLKSIDMKIDVIELMGSEMFLYCNLNDFKITIRTPVVDGYKLDSILSFTINKDKIHIFDKETEMVISKS